MRCSASATGRCAACSTRPTTAGEHVCDAPVISSTCPRSPTGSPRSNLALAIAMVCATAFLDAKRIERAEHARAVRPRAPEDDPGQRRGMARAPIAGLGDYYQAAFKLARKTGVQHWLVLHRLSDLSGRRRRRNPPATPRRRAPRRRVDHRSSTASTPKRYPAPPTPLGLSETERATDRPLPQGVALWRVGGRSLRGPTPPLRPRMGADRHRQAMGPRRDPPTGGTA